MTATKTELAEQAAEQKELMEQMDAELKASVADEFRNLEENTITAEALEAEPDKTARNFLRLYADYRKLEAQAKALKKERPGLVSKASRAEVMERRLEQQKIDTESKWLPIPSLDDGKILCTAAALNGVGRRGVVLLKFSDGKTLHTTEIKDGVVRELNDGGFMIEAR